MTEEVKAQRDITVARPFRFTYKSGVQKDFGKGVHLDVGDEVADHWYTQHHLLRDGERVSAPVDVSDPAATARRILSLEDEKARLQAEVTRQSERADKAEADLVEANDKLAALTDVSAERDLLQAEVDRLSKAKPASKAA